MLENKFPQRSNKTRSIEEKRKLTTTMHTTISENTPKVQTMLNTVDRLRQPTGRADEATRHVPNFCQRLPHFMLSVVAALLVVSVLPARLAQASTLEIYKNARLGHRIVQTRYGRLHGLILPLDNFRFLRSVEVFLGVPYATPPTKQNRFSPTRAPAPWDGIRISDKYSPVCPQRLPNIQNETAAMEKMPKGRLEYLKRLLPFLENQSEDCLYLNIFSPNNGANEKKLPVMVFIHGESFEWSSGNPYDGSVLASYGEVVVVTLNYRLGILGFLNANPNPQAHARVANYGLMDQMAALHWIQQNIQKFGGDPNAVTLAGHGTGAACINFLMTSPTMVRGLFHRAILMSGSAYSSWALVEDPVSFAIKLAKEVNCSIPEDLNKHHEQIVDCLRDVPLDDLYAADIQAPNFLTSFGPSVDGVVIRPGHSNFDIDDLMMRSAKRASAEGGGSGSGQSFFGGGAYAGGTGGGSNYGGGGGATTGAGSGNGGGSSSGGVYYSALTANYASMSGGANLGLGGNGAHYDVLFGVVTGESIWRFSAHDIQNGFEGERRDKIIRTYVRNAYNYHLNEIFYTIVNEYTDWDRTSQHPINTRDTAVAALSDAQFVAPIIRTGDQLAANSPPPISSSSSSGGGTASASTASAAQSGRCYFYVFDYQTKDGDYPQRMGTVHGEDLPYIFGAPLVDGFSHFPQNYTKSEIALSEAVIIFWTNFARTGNPNEHHRQDSVLPASKERNRFRSTTWENYDPLHQKYLEIGMKPRIKNHFRAHQLSIWLRLIPELHRAGMEDVITRHNLFKNHDDMNLYEGPVKPDPFASTRLLLIDDALLRKAGRGGNLTGSYISGVLGVTTVEPNMFTTCIPVGGNYTPGAGAATSGAFAPNTLANSSSDSLSSGFEAAGYAAYSTALSVTIAIGCSLLILNVLIFAGVYYQRDKTRLEVKTLQKQYQQRSMHQQVPYPPDPIKHAHYHMGHSQSANVIVDVENHGGDPGAMLLAAAAAAANAADVKPPPSHICANAGMQLSASVQQQQQQQGGGSSVDLCGISTAAKQQQQQQHQQQQGGTIMVSGSPDISAGLMGGVGSCNVTYSATTKQQQQHQQQQQQQQHLQQQQQQREHMQIKGMNSQTFGRIATSGSGGGGAVTMTNNMAYNTGMMTLPKASSLHHTNSINYGRNPGGGGGGGNSTNGGGSSMTAALLDARGNLLLTSGTGVSMGDCMTLPRNVSASAARHGSVSDIQQQQQQYQQQAGGKLQANGGVMTGVGSQQQHIRAPRPPIRTASSAPTSGSGGGSGGGVSSGGLVASGNAGIMNNLIDQTPSNGSSSSGVSSAPSSKGHSHHHLHALAHSNAIGDGIGMSTTSTSINGGGGSSTHLQQQVPQAAIDEMRV